MWYSIDFNRLVSLLLPMPLNRPAHKAWLEMLVSPLKHVHDQFIAYRIEVNRRLRFNGQIIILENILNDNFDNTNRGIRIDTNNDTLRRLFIYQYQEQDKEFVHQYIESRPLYIFQAQEEFEHTFDFLVIVPDGILTLEEESRIKALTNRWKIDGKRGRFIYESGQIF